MFVPPDLHKHSEILARHIRWVEDTEDWKGAKSKLVYKLEGRQEELSREMDSFEEAAHKHELAHRDDRTYLELEFAKLREEISLLKRDHRHTITIAIVLWVVLTTLFGIAIRFL